MSTTLLYTGGTNLTTKDEMITTEMATTRVKRFSCGSVYYYRNNRFHRDNNLPSIIQRYTDQRGNPAAIIQWFNHGRRYAMQELYKTQHFMWGESDLNALCNQYRDVPFSKIRKLCHQKRWATQ